MRVAPSIVALAVALSGSSTRAFTSFSRSFTSSSLKFASPSTTKRSSAADAGVLGPSSLITPDGYGFTCPADRILKEAGRKKGYCRASSSDTVIDVMKAITEGDSIDAALIFDEADQLLGLFTESDYIKVCYSFSFNILFVEY
jgi:hypothetical protein